MTHEKTKNKLAMVPVIFTLAWPTMFEQLMQTAVQYIDTAMVGTLGTQATAAVGATSTVSWLVGSSVSALGIGFLTFIAQSYGSGNKEQAARYTAQAVFVTLVTGFIFTILTLSLSGMVPIWMQVDSAICDLAATYFAIIYAPMLPRSATIIFGTVLRAAGDTKTPMRVGILMNLINVILNFFFIFPTTTRQFGSFLFTIPGAGLGVIGAAVASAISFTLGGIYMTIALWRHPVISPRGQKLVPNMEILCPCLKVAFPNMLQRLRYHQVS